MRRQRRHNSTRRRPFEFSKIVLATVMITYELAAFFGMYIVSTNDTQLPEYLTFIGAPTAVAIGFYAWKAKAENIRKIDKTAFKKFIKGDEENDSI